MNEIDAAYSWLALTLKGDVTLRALPVGAPIQQRWYRHVAPARDPGTTNPTTYPVGIFSRVGGRDTRGVGQCRVLTVSFVDVKIVAKAGTDVSAAVSRVDTLLDVPTQASPITSVVVDGVTYWIHGCSRREELSFATLDDTQLFEHAGGTYELTISR